MLERVAQIASILIGERHVVRKQWARRERCRLTKELDGLEVTARRVGSRRLLVERFRTLVVGGFGAFDGWRRKRLVHRPSLLGWLGCRGRALRQDSADANERGERQGECWSFHRANGFLS